MSKVSVIVPVYNVEPYLNRCIDSILKQTFSDFELLIVDDGDKSACGEMLDAYALFDSRIVIVHKKNGGVSTARNSAVDIANGEFITFVDSDDWIENDLIEKLMFCIDKTNADIATGSFREFDRNYNEIGFMYPCCEQLSKDETIRYYFYSERKNTLFKGSYCKLIRADIVRKIKFPIDRVYTEDFAITYRWYYEANYVVGIEDVLYNYYLGDGGICRNFSSKWLGYFYTLKELISFLDEKNISDISNFYREDRFHYLNWIYAELSKNKERDEYKKDMLLLKKHVEIIYRDTKSRLLLNASAAKKMLPLYKRIMLFWTRIDHYFRKNK